MSLPVWLLDASDVEELRPLLQSGARLSRFRRLDVACPCSHRLAEVLRTTAGDVMLGRTRSSELVPILVELREDGADLEGAIDVDRSRGRLVAVRLHEAPDEGAVEVQCECSTARLPVTWLREQIASGRRRIVWAETEVRPHPWVTPEELAGK